METSLKLQMDVKNNAEDLRMYMLDMQNWEEEMKRKEAELKNGVKKVTDHPPPRNRIKRSSSEKQSEAKKSVEKEKKPRKIKAYDYSAWDKYDADKACAEIDGEAEVIKDHESESGEEEGGEETEKGEEENAQTESKSLKCIDEAFYEKELGNQFVRKEKWEDAIKCYTRAIDLDPKNAIYYANRSICFIKLKNFKAAEVDATVAIQLDRTYVKAFQRRAFARAALGQIEEAKSDYQEILKLEPNNAFANSEMLRLEQKLKSSAPTSKPTFNPKTIFKNVAKKESREDGSGEKKAPLGGETKKEKAESSTAIGDTVKRTAEVKKKEETKAEVAESGPELSGKKNGSSVFSKVPEGFTVVKPIHIPPHLRSKKPLRRIPVKDITSDSEVFDEFFNLINDMPSPPPRDEPEAKSADVAGAAIVDASRDTDLNNLRLPVPETCVQFLHAWKLVKGNPEHSYSYLKKVKAENLPNIFKHSLESDLFSDLIYALSRDDTVKDDQLVHSFLRHLPRVQRFGSLVLFMSSSDRENLKKCIESLKDKKSKEELEELCRLYELEVSL